MADRAAKGDRLVRHCALVGGLLLVLSTSALAQAQSPANAPKDASEVAVQSYGRAATDCLAWTDGCVSCIRQQSGGDYSCSNIGIACQPNAIECTRRAVEPTK
jgi:hypothetical protein